jgi:hypothetical protein
MVFFGVLHLFFFFLTYMLDRLLIFSSLCEITGN